MRYLMPWVGKSIVLVVLTTLPIFVAGEPKLGVEVGVLTWRAYLIMSVGGALWREVRGLAR